MSYSQQGSSSNNSASMDYLFGSKADQDLNAQDHFGQSSEYESNQVDQEYIDGVEGNNQNVKPKRLISPGALVVYLLKGFVDREDNRLVFESIVQQEAAVSEFCRRLFLHLVIDQDSGYAYVRTLPEEEIGIEGVQRPPQLLSKRPLPFYASFMLILLRQRLVEFDQSGQFGRLVLERKELISMVKSFLHNVNNEKRLEDNLNKAIDDLCSLGLLMKLKENTKDSKIERIEVKRIISVIVTGDTLAQADSILESYVKHIQEGGRNKNRVQIEEDA